MINTMCKFYYGHVITTLNYHLDFKEGAGAEINATLDIGSYSLTEFAQHVVDVLNDYGTLNYVYSIDRATRFITISGDSAFTFLAGTGSNVNESCFDLLGFSADTSSASSQTGTASGSVWIPQFKPQDYVAFDDQQSSYDSTVRTSANGVVEAVKFGSKYTMDINFRFITDYHQPSNSIVEHQIDGVANARDFMEFITSKNTIEFMPDRNDPSIYETCYLDATPEDRDGLDFKLKEQYSKGLPGYYDTGILKFIRKT